MTIPVFSLFPHTRPNNSAEPNVYRHPRRYDPRIRGVVQDKILSCTPYIRRTKAPALPPEAVLSVVQ